MVRGTHAVLTFSPLSHGAQRLSAWSDQKRGIGQAPLGPFGVTLLLTICPQEFQFLPLVPGDTSRMGEAVSIQFLHLSLPPLKTERAKAPIWPRAQAIASNFSVSAIKVSNQANHLGGSLHRLRAESRKSEIIRYLINHKLEINFVSCLLL